jgi:hypothetical protein
MVDRRLPGLSEDKQSEVEAGKLFGAKSEFNQRDQTISCFDHWCSLMGFPPGVKFGSHALAAAHLQPIRDFSDGQRRLPPQPRGGFSVIMDDEKSVWAAKISLLSMEAPFFERG